LYNRFQLAKKYLHYYFTASSGKGHGIHSPFVFDFIKNILQDKTIYGCYRDIEKIRQQLLMQQTEIVVQDLGAGSSVIKTNKRVIADMAGSSLKPKKYAQLLFRIVQYYKPETVIELGTSFGITAAYLAAGNDDAKVFTIEGSEAIAEIARIQLERSVPGRVELITGNFNDVLPVLLKKTGHTGLGFIDGNHRKAPTLDYFHQLLTSCGPSSILIFDDIHWSAEMEEAWEEIKQHSAVTLTIDLFFIGIVFFNTDINHKQHYTIRF